MSAKHTPSLTGRNDRSIHTAHRTIKHNLQRHAELMARYVAQGMNREVASRQAAIDMGVRKS